MHCKVIDMISFDDRLDGIVRLVDLVRPPQAKEQQEEYIRPARVRIFENRIAFYEREQNDLLVERAQLVRDMEVFHAKVISENDRLNNSLINLEERIKRAEGIIRSSYKILEVERKNL